MGNWDIAKSKVCKRCQLSFELSDTYWKTPRSLLCLFCKKESIRLSSKKYKKNNKDKISKQLKAWRVSNKEHLLETKRKWNAEHKDSVKKMRKKHYADEFNRLKKHKQDYNYYSVNKNKIRSYQREWIKTKPIYQMRMRISHLIRQHLKGKSSKNGKSIFDYLEYTLDDLKKHLESLFEPWMTWDNVGTYKLSDWDDKDASTWRWSIDHIIPQSKLPYDSMDHPNFKKCWSLDNLRPLSTKENVLKGNR